MKKYTVREDGSLKKFTDDTCAQASFCWSRLLREKGIRVNGARVTSDMPVRAGDEVVYYLTPAQQSRAAFSRVFEDENVFVADKESGVNSEAVFSELCERGEFYFLHRLDRNTQGLLLFARNVCAAQALLDAFRTHRTEKRYLAQVKGHMPARHAVCNAYLCKDAARSRVSISSRPVGEKIVTEYEVLREGARTSLLSVTLHTGKTHQIRAHLAFLGHPVVGDTKYGDGALNRELHASRQRLIAKQLRVFPGGGLSYLGERTFVSAHGGEEWELI